MVIEMVGTGILCFNYSDTYAIVNFFILLIPITLFIICVSFVIYQITDCLFNLFILSLKYLLKVTCS